MNRMWIGGSGGGLGRRVDGRPARGARGAARLRGALRWVALLAGLVAVMPSAFAPPPAGSADAALSVLAPDSVSIRYAVSGSGEPALVFIHCWCCDRSYWDDQMKYFGQRHRVVALDLAGHGESGMERTEYTVGAFAADVAAVVDALGLKHVILVGHSMGGDVSLEAARLLGERVVGIIGVDTFQDFGQRATPEQSEQFLAAFRSDFPRVTAQFVRSMFSATADSALVARVSADMAAEPAEVGIGSMKGMLDYDPRATLALLDAPIRAVNSDKWPTNVEGNRTLTKSFEAEIIPGRGHFLHLEDPVDFNRALEAMIGKIVAGS